MKSLKLLITCFTVTFITLVIISPVNAQTSSETHQFQSISSINLELDVKSSSRLDVSLPSDYTNSFSSSLILANATILGDKNKISSTSLFNNSLDFFTSMMVFNDKLHQFIAYFSTFYLEDEMSKTNLNSKVHALDKECNT